MSHAIQVRKKDNSKQTLKIAKKPTFLTKIRIYRQISHSIARIRYIRILSPKHQFLLLCYT